MGKRNANGGRKKRKFGKDNKWQKVQAAKKNLHKKEIASIANIEDANLLSKQQLKNLIRQPTNSIRPSGKRKRKMLKRIGHQKKQDSKMDFETTIEEEKPATKKTKKAKKQKVEAMDVEESDASDDEETAEMNS